MPVSRLTRIGATLATGCAWVFAQAPAPSSGPDNSARQKLIETLDGIANQQLAERAEAVARIQTRAEAERRKTQVREKILGLIGGIPEHHGAVAVKQFGSLTGDGFRVEKLAYESFPGLWVTANLYLPATGNGPFPAVLLAPGHEASGKQSQYSFGGNFARSGVIALAIDPLGQGERLQYFDPEKKASTIGGSTGEHGEVNVPAMLIGEDVARYFVNDSMRGIDYLISRRDVNADRIGALGCSGGGTSTAYLAALDDRVKVAGVACYITSFKELLPSATGVQEAEQSIPHFIEQGLDFGDYVELFAPKPYAIISTTNDMFPFEGAKQTHEEAARIYKLYGAENQLQWITGPGGHGNLGPISPAILGFFLHYLKDEPPLKSGPAGDAPFTPLRIQNVADLLCTPTGQVSTSLGGETVPPIVKARAAQILPKTHPAATEVAEDVRGLAGVVARPSSRSPVAMVGEGEQREGYRFHKVTLQSEDGEVTAWVAIPNPSGLKPAVLMVDAQPEKLSAVGGDFDRLAKSGKVVMALGPKPSPPGTEGLKSPYLGPFNLLSLRAFLVGKTILGMRVDDTIKAVDWLISRGETDSNAITVYGSGAMGAVVLHAAVLDPRVKKVVIENTLASYRMVLDQPLHRNISEIMIPGVLAKYDIGDLLTAVAPRSVTVINPQDATGANIGGERFRKELGYVFEAGKADWIKVVERGAADPLPLD
jgi:cephalosporin-C deacetylase-like acetyl esterase